MEQQEREERRLVLSKCFDSLVRWMLKSGSDREFRLKMVQYNEYKRVESAFT